MTGTQSLNTTSAAPVKKATLIQIQASPDAQEELGQLLIAAGHRRTNGARDAALVRDERA